MCKMLLGIQLNQNENFSKLIKAQEEPLKTQKDGVGALVIDSNHSVYKGLSNYNLVFDEVYQRLSNAKIVGIHTRQATSGEINLTNAHFFERNYPQSNYKQFFAHNGIVGQFHDHKGFYWKEQDWGRKKKKEEKQEEKLCDSNQFFRSLDMNISSHDLYIEAIKKDFTGIAALIKEKERTVYVISTKQFEIHTDKKDYLIFYSYKPEDSYGLVKDFLGFPLKEGEEKIETNTYKIDSGYYEFKY